MFLNFNVFNVSEYNLNFVSYTVFFVVVFPQHVYIFNDYVFTFVIIDCFIDEQNEAIDNLSLTIHKTE